MAHLVGKAHLHKPVLARVNAVVMFGTIGGGLAGCVLGAAVYDLGRLCSFW